MTALSYEYGREETEAPEPGEACQCPAEIETSADVCAACQRDYCAWLDELRAAELAEERKAA